MSTHNIIGNQVGTPFIGGPNTGSINGGRKRSPIWVFALQAFGLMSLMVIALGAIALLER